MINNLLLDEIFNKIEFKIQPNENVRKKYIYRIKKNFYKLINKEKQFIGSNTIFKNIEDSDLDVINKLLLIDTMSKISIGFIINQISKKLGKEETYLNIGVWRGFSMFAGMLNTKCQVYGVDDFSFDYEDSNSSLNNYEEALKAKEYFYKNFDEIKKKEKHFFFDMDYIKFFELWQKKNKAIDFYYYDAEHSYKNQYNNLIIAKEFFKKGTIILVDDYNEIDVESATQDFVAKFNSEFKIIKEIKTANKYIHPTYANGIVLIEKIN